MVAAHEGQDAVCRMLLQSGGSLWVGLSNLAHYCQSTLGALLCSGDDICPLSHLVHAVWGLGVTKGSVTSKS